MTAANRTRGETSLVIAAPATRLWEMVSDITRMGEWSPETDGGEWLGDAIGPAVGARFRCRNRRGRTRWSTTSEVIAATPGTEFAFGVGGASKPSTTWRYLFEPTAAGTRVIESFEFRKPPGMASRLLTRLTIGVTDRRADLEEGMRRTLAAVRTAAEEAVSARA